LSPEPGAPAPAGGLATRGARPEEPGEAGEAGGPAAAGPAAKAPEVAERPRAALVARRLAVAAALVALDLWSKARVFAWLGSGGVRLVPDACDLPHRRYPLAGEWLAFMLSQNKGAAFGQLDQVPYLLVGGRILAVVFLLYMIARTGPHRRVLTTALVLVLAGALGNLYDNLLLAPPIQDAAHPFGYVRDFIDVYFTRWHWHFPTFNVADSCITVGAALLLVSGFGSDKRERS
jgi:signal peptidase II